MKTYDQLSLEAQDKARIQVVEAEVSSFKQEVSRAKSLGVHNFINKEKFKKLQYQSTFIQQLKNDKVKLEKIILGNLCQFQDDGSYITFKVTKS